jgi:pseudolysin
MERFNARLLSLACCLYVIGVSDLYAANVQYLWDKTQNIKELQQVIVINHVESLKETIPGKAQLFHLNNKATPGNYEYRLRNAFIDQENVTHARYDEFYKNLRVLWADTVVHNLKSQSINGTLVTGIEKDLPSITPKLTEAEAIAIAKQDFMKNFAPNSKDTSRLMKTELVIYPYAKDDKSANIAYLAYYINYYATGKNNKLVSPTYVIDANSGAVLNYFDDLKRDQATGTGPGGNTNTNLNVNQYNYGTGAAPLLGFLLVQPNVGLCTWGNRGVAVVSLGNATNNPSVFPILQDNEFNYPIVTNPTCANVGDPTNGAYSPNDDVLYFSTQAYALFAQNSIKNPKAPFGQNNPTIKYYVHINSTQAFAQPAGCGGVPDACYNQQIVLANGTDGVTSQTFPTVGYDVVGHETAHIYIALTSGLVYENQSGGLDEAFADITGVALGAFVKNSFSWFPPLSNYGYFAVNNAYSFWSQGALDSIPTTNQSSALRYLYNPPLDGNSIDNASNFTSGMDVHFSSGVYNKAFYNMSLGLGNGILINVPAILKAYRFMVVANDAYWTRNMNFNQASCGVMLAAQNPVYGGNTFTFNIVKQAFAAVGVHCMRVMDNISVTA